MELLQTESIAAKAAAEKDAYKAKLDEAMLIEDLEERQKALDGLESEYKAAMEKADAEFDYWSNVNGENNLVNFKGWLKLNTDKSIYNEIVRAQAAEEALQAALDAEIIRATEAEAGLDVKIVDIISNTDVTAIDSFTEVIQEVNDVTSSNYYSLMSYTQANRPSMLGFKESPEMVDSEELDEDGNAIMVLRDTFTAPIIKGTHIVFLNGLMLLEGSDYTVQIVDQEKSLFLKNEDFVAGVGEQQLAQSAKGAMLMSNRRFGEQGTLSVVFAEAPALSDRLNIYGVSSELMDHGVVVVGDGEGVPINLDELMPQQPMDEFNPDLADENGK